MEDIHHQPEIGTVHTVHHGGSLCQGVDEIGLHDGNCLQCNSHISGCPVISQFPECFHCQVFCFFSGTFTAILSSHPSNVYVCSQKACKINDFLAPADSLPANLLPGVSIAQSQLSEDFPCTYQHNGQSVPAGCLFYFLPVQLPRIQGHQLHPVISQPSQVSKTFLQASLVRCH